MYVYTRRKRILIYTQRKYTLKIIVKDKMYKSHTDKVCEENLWFNIGLNNYNRTMYSPN